MSTSEVLEAYATDLTMRLRLIHLKASRISYENSPS